MLEDLRHDLDRCRAEARALRHAAHRHGGAAPRPPPQQQQQQQQQQDIGPDVAASTEYPEIFGGWSGGGRHGERSKSGAHVTAASPSESTRTSASAGAGASDPRSSAAPAAPAAPAGAWPGGSGDGVVSRLVPKPSQQPFDQDRITPPAGGAGLADGASAIGAEAAVGGGRGRGKVGEGSTDTLSHRTGDINGGSSPDGGVRNEGRGRGRGREQCHSSGSDMQRDIRERDARSSGGALPPDEEEEEEEGEEEDCYYSNQSKCRVCMCKHFCVNLLDCYYSYR
jgi:hypothetical protein